MSHDVLVMMKTAVIKRKVTSPKIKTFDILQKHFSQENITDRRFPLSEE